MENAQKKEVLTPVTIETLHMERKNGPDCDKPDSLRLNCVEVNFSYPTIKEGPEALKTAVDTWARDFLTGMVAFADEPDNMPPLEEAIQGFFHLHDEAVRDFPDGPAYFVAETKDTLLFNDGKYLTLKLDGYSYAGGAHPNPTSTVVTWEITAGRKLKLENLVGDLPALQKIAEQKFRQVRADDFKEGFEFDETFPFKLADNTGLLKDGIYFCYVPYEVGPYAMGYTEFVIPFIDIQQILTSKEEKNK
jgi:hypothetical protein